MNVFSYHENNERWFEIDVRGRRLKITFDEARDLIATLLQFDGARDCASRAMVADVLREAAKKLGPVIDIAKQWQGGAP